MFLLLLHLLPWLMHVPLRTTAAEAITTTQTASNYYKAHIFKQYVAIRQHETAMINIISYDNNFKFSLSSIHFN